MSKATMEQKLDAILKERAEALQIQQVFFDLVSFLSDKTKDISLTENEIDSLIMSLFSDTDFPVYADVPDGYEVLLDDIQQVGRENINFLLYEERKHPYSADKTKSFCILWRKEKSKQLRG